jgi:molybdopterin-guanine dinucleotide biosynthesis protein A
VVITNMINAPQMFMLGSTGRNSGRIEFACATIEKFCEIHKVVGVKVTVVKEADGKCSRKCNDCGVCTDLETNFVITREDDEGRGKDTERMAAAGASNVYWLRVRREEHLHEGISELLQRIDKDAFIVCESNSLRAVVNPGIFLIFSHHGDRSNKGSTQAVRQHMDRLVSFDDVGFDLDLGDIAITSSEWTLRMDATAIVLAGGMSRRMKTDKSMLPIEGIPMIEHIHGQLKSHFKQTLVSANDIDKYAFLGTEVVPDSTTGQGPLMGIASVLAASEHDLNFVTACDMPEVNMGLVRRMLREADGFDAVVPTANGRMEPLFAIYRKSLRDVFQDTLAQGKRKIRDAFDECSVKYLDITEAGPLMNLNTREDYAGFISPADEEAGD